MYTGYTEVMLNNEQMSKFYQEPLNFVKKYELKENEYLIINDINGMTIDKYCYQNENLRKILFPTITNDYNRTIKPRNEQQVLAVDMLQDRTSKVKLIRGVYGSGKDILMLNQALSYIENGLFKKIVFIRPNVTVANVPEIGYLKGGIEDKLGWTLAPFYDKVGGEEGIFNLIEREQLELVPLLFVRGRSFENSIVYVCEGQNITTEIAKLIISRVGEGSELWLNADNHQTDKKIFEQDNGIRTMIERLSGNSLFGYVYLPKTERGAVANLANLLDEEN